MSDTPSSPSPGEVSAEQIAEVLAARYRLPGARVEIIPLGVETDNAVADTSRGRVFVKAYPVRADLEVMAGRIELMRRGRAAGSPIPAAHPDVDGALITRHEGVALSVWDWVDAASLEKPFTAAHGRQIGTALGRLHTALADCPTGRYKANKNRWWEASGEALAARGHELLALIEQVAEPTEEDLRRREQVVTRIAQVKDVAALQAPLPPAPREQVVHFDFTGANLLWDAKGDGEVLAAVIDLQARTAFPTWELGRILYEPHTVVESDAWRRTAVEGVLAYAAEVPREARAELPFAARMALLHNLTSFFGIDALYEKHWPGAGIYARFWDLRARAAERMLPVLEEIEAELAEALGG
ncbi:phosphotransferase [Streptomyces sp. NPDC054796]